MSLLTFNTQCRIVLTVKNLCNRAAPKNTRWSIPLLHCWTVWTRWKGYPKWSLVKASLRSRNLEVEPHFDVCHEAFSPVAHTLLMHPVNNYQSDLASSNFLWNFAKGQTYSRNRNSMHTVDNTVEETSNNVDMVMSTSMSMVLTRMEMREWLLQKLQRLI